MASIFTFLSDQYQYQLKIKSRSERFEYIMQDYINVFFSKLENLEAIENCSELNSKLLNFTSDNKTNLFNWLKCLQDTVLDNKDDCEKFCKDLITIYNLYLNGSQAKSSFELNKLMVKHDLFDSIENFGKSYPITYRGRYSSNENEEDIQPDYFYHIPFNQLSYVKNYRFSLTGQPFIYLGASIPTVVLEVRSKLDAFEDLELSQWALNQNKSLIIYDISNSFYDLINLNMIAIFKVGSGINCENNDLTPNKSTFLIDFKKFILSQFCTFKKSEGSGQFFIEQYVIPQLLTEQIRNYDKINYDGFVFPSTQYADKVKAKEKEIYYGLFKNNIALFTEYSSDTFYDNGLISKFSVKTIDKANKISFAEFKKEMALILKNNPSQVILKAKVKVLCDYYDRMLIDGSDLTKLEAIEIQLYAMLDYIKTI